MLMFSRIGPDTSYFTDVLPAATIFGLGLSTSVAPVTATAIGSVPDGRSGAASGTNNATARTGQLLAVAAIPAVVGLTGGALSDPVQLDAGFAKAMYLGAAFVALGGLAALALLGGETPGQLRFDHQTHPIQCPVDGPHPRPALRRVSGDALGFPSPEPSS
jgi:hypothetical protein